ncbi:hypothetical protein [Dermatophilus congolensis]|uniref:hypothetical protein n=1 Tax=Dermatophilus congolensis TaxID=1863 RepID=UPI001AAF13DA|nr:hypothetical protein [Dermatophilus congolensis]MBO3143094.1 hypothetical protein [Dermatophilus congolensis]MBO3152080.1 hypothetical protein [Dermatophilus congolensis]MBO3160907.1 hypothetical protein [Dermatophilus congolensis]MBO3163368.1 hypothetical protein [Dermatophilus congolensis]MBO3176918.1 hypothetical protein [Dermatophilus congolensis]
MTRQVGAFMSFGSDAVSRPDAARGAGVGANRVVLASAVVTGVAVLVVLMVVGPSLVGDPRLLFAALLIAASVTAGTVAVRDASVLRWPWQRY